MSKGYLSNANIPNIKGIQISRTCAHLLMLFFIFIAPELLFNIGEKRPIGIYAGPALCVLIFYLNYYLLVDKFLLNKNHRALYFVINVALIFLCIIAINGVRLLEINIFNVAPPMPIPPQTENAHHAALDPFMHNESTISHLFRITPKIVPFICALLLSIALKMGEKWYSWSLMEQQMQSELKENELKNLKNQLNPHFLFNTLNNIYSLIAISQDKAQLAVHNLSQLLRYILYNNENEVPLSKELQFIQNYIDLMKLRISSMVTLNVNIDKDVDQSVTIAPLMFISLVENAFKHGISSKGPSTIDIQIHYDGTQVICHVQNSLFPKDKDDKSGSGIGITNLKKQLDIIYPDRYSFNISSGDKYYTTDLIINLSPKN